MNQSELSPLEKAIAKKIDKTKNKSSQPGYLRKLVAKLHLRIEAALARGCEYDDLAAVEILGASGEKILKAKTELEELAQGYQTQVIKSSNQMIQQLESQLSSIKKKQDDLDWKLVEVLESIAREHQNLQTISTGLVNSTMALLAKQKQMLVQTEAARPGGVTTPLNYALYMFHSCQTPLIKWQLIESS